MLCPKCGKEMNEGRMPAGSKSHLFWFPSADDDTDWKRMRLSRLKRIPNSVEEGFYLVPKGNPLGVVYLPACICPECQLVILDYDPEKAELDGRTAKYFVDR